MAEGRRVAGMRPPGTCPNESVLAANQGGARSLPLLDEKYDLLTTEGRFICRVTRDEASQAIAARVAEGVGRTCVKYLKIDRIDALVPLIHAGSAMTCRVRDKKHQAIAAPLIRKHRDDKVD